MISSGGTTTLGLYDFKVGLDDFGKINYWENKSGGYLVNKLVMLSDGTVVQNTLSGNLNNPNTNMMGWEFFVSVLAPDVSRGKKLRMIAGVARNSGSGWSWINNSGHTPIGMSPTISVSGANLVINYGFTATKVVSLLAVPDETFAGYGFTIGGSVGTSLTNLQINAPLVFTVDTANGSITAPSHFSRNISATTASGVCTITHNAVTAIGDAPSINRVSATNSVHTDITPSYSTTSTLLYGVGYLDGQFSYNGSSWEYFGEIFTVPTASWVVSGGDAYLEVTHQQTDVFNISVSSRTTLRTVVAGVSGTLFRVRFYDQSGTLLLSPTTNMQFLFSRKAYLRKNVIRGMHTVRRGYARILPDQLGDAGGNIWIMGLMEVDA